MVTKEFQFGEALASYIENPSVENANTLMSFDQSYWGDFLNTYKREGILILLEAAYVGVEQVSKGFQEIFNRCEKDAKEI